VHIKLPYTCESEEEWKQSINPHTQKRAAQHAINYVF